jgi:hypothetical protein
MNWLFSFVLALTVGSIAAYEIHHFFNLISGVL